MDRTRDVSWMVRLAVTAGMIVFGTILLGAGPAMAAPVAPVGPTEIAVPTAPPLPPKPPKCGAIVNCLPPTLEPCFQLPGTPCTPPTKPPCWDHPGHTCTPPTVDPCLVKKDCQPPSTKPTEPTRPSTKVATPTNPPTTDPTTSIPTPNRIDTGEGTNEVSPNWVMLGVPALVLLTIVAGGGIWWLRRSEERR